MLYIGIPPPFFEVSELLNGIVNFEQRMIKHILGLPAPSLRIPTINHLKLDGTRLCEGLKAFEGGIFIRNLLLVILRLFFAVMVTVITIGLGFIALPAFHIISMNEMKLDILEIKK